jgi:hypothetical protein
MRQQYLRNFDSFRRTGFNRDFDMFGSGANAGVHAAGGHEPGLGLGLAKGSENGDEMLVGEVALVAAEQARDMAARKARLAGDVSLVQLALFGEPFECSAKIAHFFAPRVPFYATSRILQPLGFEWNSEHREPSIWGMQVVIDTQTSLKHVKTIFGDFSFIKTGAVFVWLRKIAQSFGEQKMPPRRFSKHGFKTHTSAKEAPKPAQRGVKRRKARA